MSTAKTSEKTKTIAKLNEFLDGISEAEVELSDALSELCRTIGFLGNTDAEFSRERRAELRHRLQHELLKLVEHANTIRTFASTLERTP